MTAVARKPGRPRDVEKPTMADSLRTAILAMLSEARAIAFPCVRYQRDPIAFFEDILGVTPWEREAEVLRALVDHDRVAVKSGRRVSKSHLAAGAALWFYGSFEDARVTMTSTTARQVDDILWRELCMMRMRGGRCVRCKAEIEALVASGLSRIAAEAKYPRPCPHSAVFTEEPGVKANTGLRSPDFRLIKGATAREPEAFQGISGANQLFIGDEASGIAQGIFDAISGNRAGGGKVLLLGNPTKNEGEFYDAFGRKAKAQTEGLGYHGITISSEESPNVKAGRVVIPGLATREYIREREIEWGRESPMFKIHVLGEFAIEEEGRIFSVHSIAEAEERWQSTPDTGRLFIGLDPAGESGSGDETVFAIRRGLKCIEIIGHRGLNEEQHLVHLLALLNKHRGPRESPVVVFDREGSIGSALYGRLKTFIEQNPSTFDLVAVRASDRASRRANVYDRMRDGLCANLEAWFRDGGAIPTDVKLSAELHSLEWKQAVNGRLKVTPKDTLRKVLGRSPDRYDALALACWEPLSLMEGEIPASVQAVIQKSEPHGKLVNYNRPVIDPYVGFGYSGRR